MAVTRRTLLRAGAVGAAASLAPLVASCSRLWVAPRGEGGGGAGPLLVVIFLRGGADGLHLVPALGDPHYARLRGSLALGSGLPFAAGFALHPAFEALQPLVERGELAVVHAAGSPHPTRSHFEAQDFMEAGLPGARRIAEGWMTRALGPVTDEAAFSALALSSELPVSLYGSDALALSGGVGLPRSRPLRAALDALYAGGDGDPVRSAGRRALARLGRLERLGIPRDLRAWGVRSLGARARALLKLERSGLEIRAAFLDDSGWDSHFAQGAESGAVAARVRELGGAIAALVEGARRHRELRLVVMSEFGRTVRPNGAGGTDHGHGGVMLVTGAGVRGGLYGDWRGLAPGELYEGRDLPVRTDFRSVLFELLRAHLGARPPAGTFPGFEPAPLGLLS